MDNLGIMDTRNKILRLIAYLNVNGPQPVTQVLISGAEKLLANYLTEDLSNLRKEQESIIRQAEDIASRMPKQFTEADRLIVMYRTSLFSDRGFPKSHWKITHGRSIFNYLRKYRE